MTKRYLYRKNSNKTLLQETSLPTTIEDLIKLLNETFPLINPTLDKSLSEIQRKAGQRDVVEWLIQLKSRKEENVLRNDE